MSDDGRSLHQARLLLQLGRLVEAEAQLRDAVAADPDNAEAHALLSYACRSDPERSHGAALTAVRIAPDDANAHLAAAWASERIGDRRAAVAHARAAVRLQPEWAAAHVACAQLMATDPATWDEAQTSARHAIQLDPTDPTAWVAAGDVALQSGHVDLARQNYEHALALDPEHAIARANLAAARAYAGEAGHAMVLLSAMVRADPSDQESRDQIDRLGRALLHEIAWLGVPIGFMVATVTALIGT